MTKTSVFKELGSILLAFKKLLWTFVPVTHEGGGAHLNDTIRIASWSVR